MPLSIFSEEDLEAIAAKGMDAEEILRQLEIFRRGVRPIPLIRPATLRDGIVQITPDEFKSLISLHDEAARRGRMLKFVPASGAASRMFNDWTNSYLRGGFDSDEGSKKFLQDLVQFAFYDDLKNVMAREGKEIASYIREGRCAEILEYILTPKGLHYVWLPKALMKFHLYEGHSRTSMEEHLVEAALYVQNAQNICRMDFTVSEEHEARIRDLCDCIKEHYESLFGVSYEINITTQLSSSDTVAVDLENRPFRDKNGKILFRPGGHGALLQNINAIEGDIIFIKNIDNVVPDRLKDITVFYKKALGGYLVRLQNEIFRNLKLLSEQKVDDEQLSQVIRFCQEKLFLPFPEDFRHHSLSAKREYIFQKLNRPLRVCGMVRNEGEAGGGPFWVEGDGIPSLQIVEQNQIDLDSEEQKEIWRSSTHFNPVDLVCGVRNDRGEKFDLTFYSDKSAVFISKKYYGDDEIKVLELPGLWNGSMAFWNTVFVEVPLETFNPVKTIDDLLRKTHLPLSL